MSCVNEKALIIIAAYNESSNIESTLQEVKDYFSNIIVINDGSDDNTLELLNKLRVDTISHCINIGQGGSLGTGLAFFLKHTNLEYAITFDADGQHRPNQAMEMLNFANKNNLYAVLGSRFLNKEYLKSIPFTKRQTLRAASIYEKIFYSINLSDAHNGLRVLHRKLVKEHLVPIRNFDMNHATEISKKIVDSTLPFEEFPVDIIYQNKDSQSTINAVNITIASLLKHR